MPKFDNTDNNDIKRYSIIVLGPGAVGKSCLTLRLVTGDFVQDYDPTIKDSYSKKILIDNELAQLDILDTAGQEEFNSMQDAWIREGQGFICVYSIASKTSFNDCKKLYDKILRAKGENDPFYVVLVGNKCDLDEKQRQITKSDGQKLAQEWNCPFYETSAKNKINNEECFFDVVRQIRKGSQPVQNEPTCCSCCSIL